MTTVAQAIQEFPRRKARTLRFTLGAPRSAEVIGDGSRALFLRSDGPEDLVTALWMSVFDVNDDGSVAGHREIKLADPRELLSDADSENVPAEERARRERAREGGQGIVSYSVDAAGDRVVFTINGQLFITAIDADGEGADTRQLATNMLNGDHPQYAPVLNPRISPDGKHVLYTTGEAMIMVDIADWQDDIERDIAERDDTEHNDAAVDSRDTADYADNAAEPRDVENGDESNAVEDDKVENKRVTGLEGRSSCGKAESDEPQAVNGFDTVSVVRNVYADVDATEDTAEDADAEVDKDAGSREHTKKIGLAEFVAGEEMDRYDGFWWSPDSRGIMFESFDSAPEPVWYISNPTDPERPAAGRRYPRALTANADVRMSIATLDFDDRNIYAAIETHDIAWDRKAYEYVAAVSWSAGHEPIMLVQNRHQNNDQVLSVTTDGDTRVLEEHANDQWLDIILGTPALTPGGRLICAMNDMDTDTNRLTIDGKPFTPQGWQVREVLDIADENVLAIVQRTPGEGVDIPSEWRNEADQHDARSYDVVTFGYDGSISVVTSEPGQWSANRQGNGIVVSGHSMSEPRTIMEHRYQGHGSSRVESIKDSHACPNTAVTNTIENFGAVPGFAPNTSFCELGEHHLLTAITKPSETSVYARVEKLPVLLKPYGGPGFQQVVLSQSYYWESQWWADQGFIVVTADGRGTTGRGPQWDREIFENMKDITLADQVETVQDLADAEPQADLDKVAMIGWSYGGFLSALAVLDAPDIVRAACAGAPPTDWTLYDTHYTERYLGLDPKVYERNGIVQDAPKLSRPLMLIHGFADDNVTIAHSLRLSQALMAAGRQHTYLPLTGITHMTNDETVAENLLIMQRDFLYEALGIER